MNKRSRKGLSGLGRCLCTIWVLLLLTKILLVFGLKSWFVINFGIRSYKHFSHSLTLFCIVYTFAMILVSLPWLRDLWRRRQQSRQAAAERQDRQQRLTVYAENNDDPQITRERLTELAREMPDLGTMIGQCLLQMDAMDKLQARQDILIKSNDASFLNDTVEAVNGVERLLCRNFQSIINLCIVAGDLGHLDRNKINRLLSDNEKNLDVTQSLLTASAEWINQCNADHQGSSDEVKHWTTTIRKMLEED